MSNSNSGHVVLRLLNPWVYETSSVKLRSIPKWRPALFIHICSMLRILSSFRAFPSQYLGSEVVIGKQFDEMERK